MTLPIRSLLAAALVLAAALPLRAATEIVEVVSPGGITAWLVEEDSIPMLAIEAHFEGGAALDPDDKLGATRLMTGLLEEGAGELDSQGFAAAVRGLAARFRFDSGSDGVSISAAMLTENRAASVELLALALTRPAFADEAVARVRAQLVSGLRADETDPNVIASHAMSKALFGDHPAARPADGTVETVSGLTRDDLVAAHRAALVRDRLTVGVVGDITPEELGPLLDRLFGALPETGPPLPEPPDIAAEGSVTVIPFDTPQAVIRFGHRGIADDDPDFLAATVVNQVLGGGGFTSRLTTRLREERGLTYGVYTFLAGDPDKPRFMGSVSTANATAGEALALVREEWARMAAEGLSAEEFEDARRYLTGSYPLRFDGNRRIASILVGMQLSGLPIGYPQIRNDLVEALTLEEVNRVAARLLQPEALSVVVVGRPEGIDAGQ